MKRSQVLKRFVAILGATLLISACGGEESVGTASKKIIVGTEPAFPPFESKSAGGELVGFDIDLMKAVARNAGLTVEFQSLPFDGLIPALQAKTIDAAISAITITPERAQTIRFSRPYFKAGLAIAVREENATVTSLESLKGKRIAVQIGTTGAKKAKTIPSAEVREFDSAPLALQELANQNVDAVINDAPVTLNAIKSGNIKGLKVVDQLVTEEFYGIALPQDSPYQEAIDKALTQLIADGTYAELHRKWFEAEPPELPKTIPAPSS